MPKPLSNLQKNIERDGVLKIYYLDDSIFWRRAPGRARAGLPAQLVAQASLGAPPPGDVASVEGVGEFQGEFAPQGQGTMVAQAEA